MKNIFYLIPLILSAMACDREQAPDCLKKTGDIVEQKAEVPAFKTVEIYDLFTVNLVQDTINQLVITGGENMLPKVKWAVSDSLLSISNENTCNWTRSYQKVIHIDLHYTDLNFVKVSGQITLTNTDTLHANYFKVIVYSKAAKADLTVDSYLLNFQVWFATGEYYLRGRTRHNWIFNGRYGYIFAGDLVSSEGHIENYSTGHIEVNVSDTLRAWIGSSGDIIYNTQPDTLIIEELSGTGRLLHRESTP